MPSKPSAGTFDVVDLTDGLVYDAVRVRLIEIVRSSRRFRPMPLRRSRRRRGEIAAMSDRLAHRYFDAMHAIVAATESRDLPELEAAVMRLRAAVAADDID